MLTLSCQNPVGRESWDSWTHPRNARRAASRGNEVFIGAHHREIQNGSSGAVLEAAEPRLPRFACTKKNPRNLAKKGQTEPKAAWSGFSSALRPGCRSAQRPGSGAAGESDRRPLDGRRGACLERASATTEGVSAESYGERRGALELGPVPAR